MKTYAPYILLLLLVAALLFCISYYVAHRPDTNIDQYTSADRPPDIYPDYSDITIPPNIAPLNFLVKETATQYYVKIYSEAGETVEVRSFKPKIQIPIASWQRLLDKNHSKTLNIDIYIKDPTGNWTKFQTIKNKIANDKIDPFLVYRKLKLSLEWNNMGIYQRNLQNFAESIVLHNNSFKKGCINCHSFRRNNPDNMLMQIRSAEYGTPMLMARDTKLTPVSTKTKFTPGKVGFTAWHPSENVIAFSINKFEMFFHTADVEVREVFCHASDLALYLVDSDRILSTADITKPDRMETFPEWSPDGRFLYFSSAPQLPAEQHRNVRADLMRIPYDHQTQKWGQLETVLYADQVNGSISQPRFSPDGRFLLFNVSEYSVFPIHQAKSDLYILKLETGKYHKLPISSERCDTWHSFSSNGRWLVFSSKRMDGRFAKPFFAYFDENGNVDKPFVMPQLDPAFYDSLLDVYNIPELLTKPITLKTSKFTKAIRQYKKLPGIDVITGATPDLNLPKPDWSAPGYDEPWKKK